MIYHDLLQNIISLHQFGSVLGIPFSHVPEITPRSPQRISATLSDAAPGKGQSRFGFSAGHLVDSGCGGFLPTVFSFRFPPLDI